MSERQQNFSLFVGFPVVFYYMRQLKIRGTTGEEE